jgi:hypothetical protein
MVKANANEAGRVNKPNIMNKPTMATHSDYLYWLPVCLYLYQAQEKRHLINLFYES